MSSDEQGGPFTGDPVLAGMVRPLIMRATAAGDPAAMGVFAPACDLTGRVVMLSPTHPLTVPVLSVALEVWAAVTRVTSDPIVCEHLPEGGPTVHWHAAEGARLWCWGCLLEWLPRLLVDPQCAACPVGTVGEELWLARIPTSGLDAEGRLEAWCRLCPEHVGPVVSA